MSLARIGRAAAALLLHLRELLRGNDLRIDVSQLDSQRLEILGAFILAGPGVDAVRHRVAVRHQDHVAAMFHGGVSQACTR